MLAREERSDVTDVNVAPGLKQNSAYFASNYSLYSTEDKNDEANMDRVQWVQIIGVSPKTERKFSCFFTWMAISWAKWFMVLHKRFNPASLTEVVRPVSLIAGVRRLGSEQDKHSSTQIPYIIVHILSMNINIAHMAQYVPVISPYMT